MKIAITAMGDTLDSDVDPRFGRAKYFALYETDDGSVEFIGNEQSLNSPSGAGIQAGSNVVKSGAKVLVTGNCGPKAFRVLEGAGIKVVIGAKGTIGEVAEKFKKGEYEYSTAANVEGHW